jgi:hypothetical protein
MQQAKEVYEGVGGANVEAEAETVIAEVTGIVTGAGHNQVFLEAMAVITATAGATELTLRVRREGVAGTEVAKLVVSAVKSAKQEIGFQCNDIQPAELTGAKYVLTLTSAAAEKQKSVSSRITATA